MFEIGYLARTNGSITCSVVCIHPFTFDTQVALCARRALLMNAKGVGQSNISFERVFFVLLRSGTLHEPMAASHVLTFASTHLRLPHQWHCASFERAKRALLMNIDQNSGPVGQLSIHEDFQAPRSGASLWHLSVHRVLCEAPEKTDAKARAASIPRGLGTECMLRQNAKMHIRSGARASGCISRLLSGAPAQCLPITLNNLRSVADSLENGALSTVGVSTNIDKDLNSIRVLSYNVQQEGGRDHDNAIRQSGHQAIDVAPPYPRGNSSASTASPLLSRSPMKSVDRRG